MRVGSISISNPTVLAGEIKLRVAELEWLERQRHPVYGGHIKRDEPLEPDSEMGRLIELGFFVRSDTQRKKGYRLGPAGRAALAEHRRGK